jgi:hypothetical protein
MINSLQGFLNARDAIDQIIMSLNSDVGRNLVYILVEGPDDCRIYPKFFDESKSSIEYVGGGKEQVLIALEELNKNTLQVLGVCDADFAHLEKKSQMITNLFLTDYHDIEMTMLSFQDVLENIFVEYRLQNQAAKKGQIIKCIE